MKALQLQQFGELAVVELPDPAPGPGEVIIRVAATGICGSDVHGFTGENGRREPGQIMGHESAGTVHALGEGVTTFSAGQPVTFNPVVVPERDIPTFEGREQMSPNKQVIGVTPSLVSSFAQLIAVPARNVVPLNPEMPIELGALIEPLAVAVHAVRRSNASEGDAVLVLGGGPIGQSVVLALKMRGVENIVVTEVLESRRRLVEALGARSVCATDDTAQDQVFTALGQTPSVAIDAVGINATVAFALAATSIGSTICLVGMGAPDLTIDAFRISTEERHLTGSFTYSAKDFHDAATWMGTAPHQARQLISRPVSLAAAPTEFQHLAQGGDTPGKVLVRLDNS